MKDIILFSDHVPAEGDHALFIDGNGNVGIGTDNPEATLDVNGTVKANEIKGDGSALTVNDTSLGLIKKMLENMAPPIGTILAYGGEATETNIEQLKVQGWLFCDGSEIERDDYSELFGVIGLSFGGGNGSTTFHLPDLRGRFVRGVDNGTSPKRDPDAGSRDASNEGGNKGDKVGSVQEDALLEHTHAYKTNIWFSHEKKDGNKYYRGDHTTNSLHEDTTSLSEGKKETRPKNIYVNWIIRAK